MPASGTAWRIASKNGHATAPFCDQLYVAKGGTIRDDQVEAERIKGKMVVPRYYWMALLMKKGKTYEGIAFLTEHRNYGKGEHIDRLNALDSRAGAVHWTGLLYHLRMTLSKQWRRRTHIPQLRDACGGRQ